MNLQQLFHKTLDRIRASSFLKSVMTLSSGAVLAQGINFLGMPFVGRLYTPSAMGDYTLIISDSAIISSVACLGMMSAFMIPEDDDESKGLCRLVAKSTFLISLITIILFYFLKGIWQLFRPEIVSYETALLVLFLYIVSSTLNNIGYAYVNRQKMYKVMFWNPVIGATVNIGLCLFFGVLGWGFVGYTIAHIASFFVNLVHLCFHANPFKGKLPDGMGDLKLLRQFKSFPLFQMPANLVSSLGTQLPVQLIEHFFGAAVLGCYSMSLRIMSIPTSLLSTPINRVFFQEASQRYNRGEDIAVFSFKILEANIKIAIIPISILMIFGEQLFKLFLGNQWGESGIYSAIMGVYQLMFFCISCLSGDFIIIRKNSWNLISSLATLLISVIMIIVCLTVKGLSPVAFLAAFSALMSLKIIIAQSFFFWYLKFSLKRYYLFVAKFILLPAAISVAVHTILFGSFFR